MTEGQRITHWREYRKLTQRELARATGMWPSKVSYLEADTQVPKTTDIKRIADVLGISRAEFYREDLDVSSEVEGAPSDAA